MTATIVTSQNLPVSTGTVAWVDSGTGASLGQSTVDSTGVATLSLPLPKAGAILVTANYLESGTAVSATGTLGLTVVGIAAPSTPPQPVTIKTGAAGTVSVAIAAVGGYTGNVTLTCSGIPSPGSCALSPSTLSFTDSSASQTTTLTINTAASTSELRSIPVQPEHAQPDMGSTVLALLCPLFLFSRRCRNVRAIKGLLVLILSAGVLTMATTGCSSGTTPAPAPSAPPAPSNPGVAAGTYTVNVVAQAGSASVTIPVSVTIQ